MEILIKKITRKHLYLSVLLCIACFIFAGCEFYRINRNKKQSFSLKKGYDISYKEKTYRIK